MNIFRLAQLRIFRGKSQLNVVIAIISIIQFSVFALSFVLPKVESQSTEFSLGKLTGAEKWITVTQSNGSDLGSADLNQKVSAEFSVFDDSKVSHSIAYRPISDDFAGRFQLIGTDQIEKEVELTQGLYPQTCTTDSCDVVLVNSENLTKVPTGLKIVGQGKLAANSPILPTIEPGTALLITSSTARVIELAVVDGFPASELWSTEISIDQIKSSGLTNFLDSVENFNQSINQLNKNLLLSGPVSTLDLAKSQVTALFNRIYSLIFSLSLISFLSIYLISRTAKSSNEKYLKSVNRISNKKFSPDRFYICISLICAIISTLIALVTAGLVGAIATQKVNFESLTSLFPLYNFAISFLVIYLALSNKAKSKIITTSFLILLTLGLIYFSEIDAKFALIPATSIFLVFLFNFAFKAKLKNNFDKNTFASHQTYFVASALITSLILATVSSSIYFLNSLNLNVKDNAVFQAPIKVRITSGGEAQPMQNNGFADYQKFAGSGEVFGVRKVSAVFAQNLISSVPIQVIGVNPAVWNYVPDITHQTGINLTKADQFPAEDTKKVGVPVTGNSLLTVYVAGLNPNTSLGVWTLNDRGESLLLNLSSNGSNFETTLPINSVSIIGFQITELPDFKARREHAVAEGKNSLPAPQGNLSLTNLSLNSKQIEFNEVKNLDYSLLNGPVYLSQVKSPDLIPAIIDKQTATALEQNNFQLKITNDVSIGLEKVGVANLLPTVPMQFALVDPNLLTEFLAANTPQLLRTSEIWITTNLQAQNLESNQLAGLTIYSQDELIEGNLAPSNAKWSQYLLIFIGFIAIVVFILSVYSLISQITQDKQFAGWNASGQSLTTMRIQLRKILIVYLFSAGVIGIITSALGIREYIKRVNFDISGNIAIPPLVVKENFLSSSVLILVFTILVYLVVFRATKKLLIGSSTDAN